MSFIFPELIVLCSPVDKSNVEPIPDDIMIDRNGVASRTSTPDPIFKKSTSIDISEKRQRLKKEASLKGENHIKNEQLDGWNNSKHDLSEMVGSRNKNDLLGMTGTTIKQVEFSHVAGVYCSSEEFGPMKISIPAHDTMLVTGIPENLQFMLHKKRGPISNREPLPERVFCSENEMDVAEVVATLDANNKKPKQQNNIICSSSVNTNCHNNYHNSLESQSKHQLTVLQHQPHPVMVTIPAAHTPVVSTLNAREHFKDHRNKSLGCLDTPPAISEGVMLKRVSSTGTPVLKRQAHVLDTGMYPENLTLKRMQDDSQATNLSMKPLKKIESPEAKRARADRLADSLRYHQEILQNSPLIKRPGERNFSGFRHCYANTVSNAVKAEPLDTSYS